MKNQTQKQYTQPQEGLCWWDGCFGEGKFPAPKSSLQPKERYFFCLEHIREYNKSWDFFRHMDDRQINKFQKDSLSGHRQTWKVGIGIGHKSMEEVRRKAFNMRGGHEYHHPDIEVSPLPKAAHDALKTLGLRYPTTLPELKKKYKELAKAHHPDLNNKTDDARIKSINQAYSLLKGVIRG